MTGRARMQFAKALNPYPAIFSIKDIQRMRAERSWEKGERKKCQMMLESRKNVVLRSLRG